MSIKVVKRYAGNSCYQAELSVILSYPDWCKVENSQEYLDFQKFLVTLEKQHIRLEYQESQPSPSTDFQKAIAKNINIDSKKCNEALKKDIIFRFIKYLKLLDIPSKIKIKKEGEDMKKKEADKMLVEQLKELKARAEKADESEEFIALNDALLKVYLMMCNAGSFDEGKPIQVTDDNILN